MSGLERLTAARQADTQDRRRRVLESLDFMVQNYLPINQARVAARAGVHRNFISKHRELADVIAAAQRETLRTPIAVENVISSQSLKTDLALAHARVKDLESKVATLEARLSKAGPQALLAALDAHPMVIALRQRISALELDVTAERRRVRDIEDENQALRETNRELARKIMHSL